MASGNQRDQAAAPRMRYAAEYPNFPEVSGTSLPLLSTVLAGFAVTITVQLLMGGERATPLSARAVAALIAFVVATLLFLSSTVFAVNAQAHNYLPFLELSDRAASRLGIADVDAWLARLEQRWHQFHRAALLTFYAGVLLLLAGLVMAVWIYAGAGLALAVATIALGAGGLVLGVGYRYARGDGRVSPGTPTRRRGD